MSYQNGVGVLIDETMSLRAMLNSMATIIQSQYGAIKYCHLPFWVEVTDDKIIIYHADQLPYDIQRQIKEYQETENKQK